MSRIRLSVVPRPFNDCGQVVHTHVPLSPRSVEWYRPKSGKMLCSWIISHPNACIEYKIVPFMFNTNTLCPAKCVVVYHIADADGMRKLTAMLGEQYLDAAAAAVLKMIICLSCCAIDGVKSLNPGALLIRPTPLARRCSSVCILGRPTCIFYCYAFFFGHPTPNLSDG